MSFRVSFLTFLLFAASGGLRPILATNNGRSTTVPNARSAIIAYWQTMLPQSTMPSAIRDLLTPNNAEANGDNRYLPISAVYGKEVNNLNPTIFYEEGTNGDGSPLLPISAFYEKETNNLNPGNKINGDDSPLLPISVSYGKETNNLNPGNRRNGDGGPLLPISASYGNEANNLDPGNRRNGDMNPYLPISAFYGDGSPLLPISAFYGKEANNLNSRNRRNGDGSPYLPISAFYGDDSPLLPISAFYGKEGNNLNQGKGRNGDGNPLLPISAFYGKEANNLNPMKSRNGENGPYLPISAFYGKEAKRMNRAIFYEKGKNEDVSPYLPISAFYGKGTNGLVHVSITNMADDADHHVHEHRHIDGGHDHFNMGNMGFLFLEDAFTPGSKVAPYIDPASSRGAPLLPRDVADSIPMSKKSFTDILRMFAPVSRAMAESIWRALELCEHPRPIKGEKRGCVTSIESMIDFAASILGTSDLRAFSSRSIPVEGRDASKVYTVLAARAITSRGDTMTCHGIQFPFKVFLCHSLVPTRVYSVTIESDGMEKEKEKIEEALVVCHLNSVEFDPMKMPLHVKPGDAPVCHFLTNDDVLWAPAATTLGTQGAAEDVVVAAQ